MPQLSFEVPEDVAQSLRQQAQAHNMELADYLRHIVQEQLPKPPRAWPKGFFDAVVGSWSGDVPEIEELPLEEREAAASEA